MALIGVRVGDKSTGVCERSASSGWLCSSGDSDRCAAESNKLIPGVSGCVTTNTVCVVGVVGLGMKGTSLGAWYGGVLLDMVETGCCLN